MKVEIKETETKFEPITITLTIESEKELCDLWHRQNISPTCFQDKKNYDCLGGLKHGVKTPVTLFNVFDELVIERKLKS